MVRTRNADRFLLRIGMIGLSVVVLFVLGHAGAARATSVRLVVSISFDDGSANQYQVRSLLAGHNMHATFFVNSGLIANSGRMTLSQLRDLAADGNEIGGHGLTHLDLTTLSATDAQHEVCADRAALQADGFAALDFAYPFGNYNASVESIVRGCGYQSARTTLGITPPVYAGTLPPADPYALIGVPGISSSTTLSRLESYVTDAEQHGGGWLQLHFHDICDDACSIYAQPLATLSGLLDWLAPRAAQGTVVKDVAEAFASGLTPSPDFGLAVSPAGPVTAGGSGGFAVTVSGSGGFASAVGLGVSGLPAGATASFDPNPASSSSTLTVTTTTTTPAGSYTLTVTGTSGGLSHTAQATLTVQAPAEPPPAGGGGGGSSNGGQGSSGGGSGSSGPSTFAPPQDLSAPTVGGHPDIVVDATSAAGAAITYQVTATDPDDSDGGISITCTPASGSVFPLGIGATTRRTVVTCVATDKAGNVGSEAMFAVTVRGARDQLLMLQNRIRSASFLVPTQRDKLDAELRSARRLYATGHPKRARLELHDFIREVQSVPRGGSTEARGWIRAAERIIAMLA